MRLLAVLLAAILAAVLARPTEWKGGRPKFRALIHPYPVERFHPYFDDYPTLVPRLPIRPNLKPNVDWINKEIDHLKGVLPEVPANHHKSAMNRLSNEIIRPYHDRVNNDIKRNLAPNTTSTTMEQLKKPEEYLKEKANYLRNRLQSKNFANSPLDKKYFEKSIKATMSPIMSTVPLQVPPENKIPSRDIRQNPNLSRNRNLVEGDLQKLNNQVTLPPVGEDIEVQHAKPPKSDIARSIYTTALIAGIGAAASLAIVAFSFGWYRLSRRAKAAADVDYPAYGVTGPTIDNSVDRKLAHSAHMSHYKHQKQQILAMESRNGMEQRSGSVTDPESEEDNEEGDYTVYECPGFATTGDMEVKNPLFTDDATPATPGTCEIVKPQPKE